MLLIFSTLLLFGSLTSGLPLRALSPAGARNGNAGSYIDQLYCTLATKVNSSTWTSYHDEVQSIWGPFCGTNRGIFVIKPADGETYNCGKLPASWGISSVADVVGLDGSKGPNVLGQYLSAVFNTSTVIGPDSCDFNGLGELHCGTDREFPWKTAPYRHMLKDQGPLRGVNVGGLFVLEPWITPELADWGNPMPDQYTYSEAARSNATMTQVLTNHWETFYGDADFAAMAALGLNHIRLPVGWWYWAEAAGMSPEPYLLPKEGISDLGHPITKIIKMAQDHDLMVILDLHGAPSSQNGLDNSGQRSMDPQIENWGDTWLYNATAKQETTQVLVAIAKYINDLNSKGITNVIMLELVNEPWVFGDMSRVRDWYEDTIPAIRAVNSTLPLLIHDAFRHEEWTWLLHHWQFDNVFMDTHIYHAFNRADFASSTAACDKSKVVAHENMACRYSAMLRFKTCTSLPTYVGDGAWQPITACHTSRGP